MTSGVPDSLERLSHAELIGVVRDLIGEVGRLRAENEKVNFALTQLKAEHQAVKDELARLKNLPPRPPHKPSGMDKATDRRGSEGGDGPRPKGEKSSRRRGSQLDKLTIDATVMGTRYRNGRTSSAQHQRGQQDQITVAQRRGLRRRRSS